MRGMMIADYGVKSTVCLCKRVDVVRMDLFSVNYIDINRWACVVSVKMRPIRNYIDIR